jgi:16S rRNA (cytosine1402-N4)-methyltransferase
MMVNKEPENLVLGLEAGLTLCRRGGRMAVISFHSGEDRIVKRFMKEHGGMVTRKPVQPGAAEVRRNRRSRSARLRVMEKD